MGLTKLGSLQISLAIKAIQPGNRSEIAKLLARTLVSPAQ
jgi:hypothetical protein